MSFSQAMKETRERIVLEHIEAKNALELDRALETFAHPRHEIIGTGEVFGRAGRGRTLLSRVAGRFP
jgi:hypothetical protein